MRFPTDGYFQCSDACFIDFDKEFGSKLLETQHKSSLDDNDLCIISNLYWEQKAIVRVKGRTSIRHSLGCSTRICDVAVTFLTHILKYFFSKALEYAEGSKLLKVFPLVILGT